MAFERFFKALWKSELQKLNDHLPREYKTLSQLLKENDPAVPTVGGDLIFLDKADLETVASLVPEKYHGRLRLPLVFIRRIDMGEGVYTVSGGLVEQLTVSSLLNDKEGFIEDYEKAVKYVYRPQLWYLKKRVRSLIVVGFFMPKIEAP
ncbi:MAG: DUF61 family protein [Candidatus Freyarchaeota archaeon]|nr:DUF61 family protein [Candidatus Freyrarchaeum guaymaensis]